MSTPSALRHHIAVVGRCNSGKSSLLNALSRQDVAIVADIPGTTTDPVRKPIELPGAGACVVIDTPGLDDTTPLGEARRSRALRELPRVDLIIAILDPDDHQWSASLLADLRSAAPEATIIPIVSKTDIHPDAAQAAEGIAEGIIAVSALTGAGLDSLLARIAETLADDSPSLLGSLVAPGDVVLLVMPQDASAPKGRLILPQVQTLRELLDRGCIAISTTPERLSDALRALAAPPALVITDSQAFPAVAATLPDSIPLTSFSILMAGLKGDLRLFLDGIRAFDTLTDSSRILIAEACSHTPKNEDIGRTKIPAILRKKAPGAHIDITSGTDFPADLRGYDLVIHCGGCMFTRRHVLARVARAAAQGVPVTNYGIFLARAAGILGRVVIPL